MSHLHSKVYLPYGIILCSYFIWKSFQVIEHLLTSDCKLYRPDIVSWFYLYHHSTKLYNWMFGCSLGKRIHTLLFCFLPEMCSLKYNILQRNVDVDWEVVKLSSFGTHDLKYVCMIIFVYTSPKYLYRPQRQVLRHIDMRSNSPNNFIPLSILCL